MIQARHARSPRSGARSIGLGLTMATALGIAIAGGAACSQTLHANGESCLKDQDCLSNYCVQGSCAAAPPLLDAEVNGDAAPLDATTDGITSETSTPEAASMPETGTTMPEASSADTGGATDSGTADAGGD